MEQMFETGPFEPGRSFFPTKNRVNLVGPVLARKPIQPNKNGVSGRQSVSAKSTQSTQVIARSEYNIVESYGPPLPVLVNEALTFCERSPLVSINCAENGWAWAVTGRRLLVWQYKNKQTSTEGQTRQIQRRMPSSQCRELSLPHCDIGHKASLICVFIPQGQQMPSCLAVSPTGDARYWPSIAHDNSSIDLNGILEGQEFDYLEDITPQGYVLVTTTCNLVLLQITLQNGRHVILHKTIKASAGFFGEVGKKFASIIFGMHGNQDKENKLVKMVCERSGGNWYVTVLADRFIQRWWFSNNGTEQFISESQNLFHKIRNEFQTKFWINREHDDIEVLCLDMQAYDNKLHILCGAVNNNHTPQMYFAIVTIVPEDETWNIVVFTPIKLTLFYSPTNENECTQLRFILYSGRAYLYSDKTIYHVNLANPIDVEVEKIEFHSQHDKILQATVANHLPIFFTRTHGLVCISPTDYDGNESVNPCDMLNNCSDSFNHSFTPNATLSANTMANNIMIPNNMTMSNTMPMIGNMTMYELDPEIICKDNKDEISQMKAAFIYHLKRNTSMCNSILSEILPPNKEKVDETDSVLDKIVVAIAEDLAEDLPAADPRWIQQRNFYPPKSNACLGSSSSLQILTQLQEKSMAMNHFVDFLHATELWDRLHAVTYGGVFKATCHVLTEMKEKLIAAITFKMLENSYEKLVDEAINIVVDEWRDVPYGHLNVQDLFFVKITKFQDVFRAFSKILIQIFESQKRTAMELNFLHDINDIVLTILNKILKFREEEATPYALPENKKSKFEYLPWTATPGKNGIRDSISHYITVINKSDFKSISNPELRMKLYNQLIDLIDFMLNGRKDYLDSIYDQEKYNIVLQQYESQRRDLIYPIVEDEYYELAAKLAEKYLDFQTLVIICDRTNNQNRLSEYVERFHDMDFAQFAINWHLTQQKQGDLFQRFKNNQAELSHFLASHPSLAWFQMISNGEMERAAEILMKLAKKEVEFIHRKKTILSLAKLAYLSSEGAEHSIEIAQVNRELLLIEYQEQLPADLLKSFGYNVDKPKVMKPEEIIHVLISDDNETATEVDFVRALELVNYTENPLDARHKIWCTAILRDSWINVDLNKPLKTMENMMFFKLIDMCSFMNCLTEYLPSIEEFLTSSELDNLVNEETFQYLLKLGYEHITENLMNQKQNFLQ